MKKIEFSAKAKRITLIVMSVILAVVLVVLVLATAYMESILNLINKKPDDSTMSSDEYKEFLENQTETIDSNYTGESINPDDVQWGENEDKIENAAHIINIVLVGQDRLPGQGRQRSDVMILCTLDTKSSELTMTSFMRDMYVPISGYKDNKMNATYAFGGMKLLSKCLEENFSVRVDGVVEVDFGGFVDLIDLVGGVEIELSNSEANYLVKWGHDATPGWNVLYGEAALEHARNRTVGNGDFSRTERQREVIDAMIKKCKGMSLTQLNGLLTKALPMITTNLSNKEIMNYLVDVFPMLTNLQIHTQQIPAEGTYKYAYFDHAGSVLLPDLDANREILKEILTK